MHGIKKNARYSSKPDTQYQKTISFSKHWPNRFDKPRGKRNHAGTTLSMITRLFGRGLRCRSKNVRRNETQAKLSMFDLYLLAKMGANSMA
jgi:hypothetical protein